MIAKVVSGGGGAGASGLAHYMDDRGRDETVDDMGGIGLFTRSGDKDLDALDPLEANAHLSRDPERPPAKDELIHLVVSLTDKEFEALGDTNAERREAFRDAIRDAMYDLEQELGVEDLRYVAAIHLDTDNPHCHIGIRTEAFDRDSGAVAHVDIPKEMLPAPPEAQDRFQRHAISGNGREVAAPGAARPESDERRTLIGVFESARRAHEAPVRLIQFITNPDGNVHARALVDGREREPTEAERLVGRWIVAATAPDAATSPSAEREAAALRLYVESRDAEAARAGKPPTAAYIEPGQLHDLVARDRVTPLDAHGGPREPYMPDREASSRENAAQPERAIQSPAETLGRELALRLTVEHLRWKLELAERISDTRRVSVADAAHGDRMREMSARDIEARAQAAARRETDAREPKTTAEREQTRAHETAAALEPHRPALEAIAQKQRGYVAHLSKELDATRERLRSVAPEAREARAALRSAGLHPKPALDSTEIGRFQEEAIARGDVKTFAYLEGLRGSGSRSPDDARRLTALATIARTETRVAERRLEEFERARHLRLFDVDGRKLSLASADRLQRAAEKEQRYYEARADSIAKNLDRAKDWTLRGVMMVTKREEMHKRELAFRAKAANLALAVDGYESSRGKVNERIGEERKQLGGLAERARQMSDALTTIDEAHRARTPAQGARPDEGRFTERELRRLEEHALTLRDPELLALVDRARSEDPKIKPEERAARAEGRALAAAAESGAAQEYARTRVERSPYTPVIYRDSQGVERTITPREVEPKGWWGRITGGRFDRAEDKERRGAVGEALFASADHLTRDTAELARFAAAARTAADLESSRLRAEGRESPRPVFSPREAARMEAYAEGTRDPGKRLEIHALVASAVEEGRVRNLDDTRKTLGAAPERVHGARDRAATSGDRIEPAPARRGPEAPTPRRDDPLARPPRPPAPARAPDHERSHTSGRGR